MNSERDPGGNVPIQGARALPLLLDIKRPRPAVFDSNITRN